MSMWSRLFGGAPESEGTEETRSRQLPSTMVAEELGEVDVRFTGGVCEVLFTILMTPQGQDAEGWQTGVALDASASMKPLFGKGLVHGPKGPPPGSLMEEYRAKGWIKVYRQGDREIIYPTDACSEALVALGHYGWSSNEVEPQARKFTAYLADNLDSDGGTTVIYWACGNGGEIEEVGDLTAEECERAAFRGPARLPFGRSTILEPAVRYFANRFEDARNALYVFLTDGELHDLEQVKAYTTKLCQDIEAGRRNPLKCVLIGMGEAVNEAQMEELDDLDSGTSVDLWDHKIAQDMRSVTEIFAELVSEHQIVAPSARIYDETGNLVKNFTDGLPAKVTFTMPASSSYFVLDVAGMQIKQSVVIPSS